MNHTLWDLLYLVGGLVLLYGGAEGLIRGSTVLALRLGLTQLVIGLTIVAFGTSSPELVVSVRAAIDGMGGIALGNVIGSNICNIALILGLSAFITPLSIDLQVVRIQIPLMIGLSILFMLMMIDGRLDRFDGAFLLVGIIGYTGGSIVLAKKDMNNLPVAAIPPPPVPGKGRLGISILFVAGGLGVLMTGASIFVSGAVSLAQALGVSQAVIGLTVVALGTSLPELATSVVAAIKKQGDIAVGNIIGSNIFNILAILGISSLVRPLQMGEIKVSDLFAMILMALATFPLAKSNFTLSRWEGGILLALYFGYMVYLF